MLSLLFHCPSVPAARRFRERGHRRAFDRKAAHETREIRLKTERFCGIRHYGAARVSGKDPLIEVALERLARLAGNEKIREQGRTPRASLARRRQHNDR